MSRYQLPLAPPPPDDPPPKSLLDELLLDEPSLEPLREEELELPAPHCQLLDDPELDRAPSNPVRTGFLRVKATTNTTSASAASM